MRKVIDQPDDRVSNARLPSWDGRRDPEGSVSTTHSVPDVWFAAVLVPIIIGCTLFAATSP